MLDRQQPQTLPEPPGAPRQARQSAVGRALGRLQAIIVRRISSSLTRRIVILNIAGLIALFIGFLWLNQTRLGVIDARTQSLSLQAEIISAAITGAVNAEAGPLELDPESLLQFQLNDQQGREEQNAAWFEFSINPARVAPILKRLVAPTRTRARVFDQDGSLLFDTSAFLDAATIVDGRPKTPDVEEQTLFWRSWNAVKQRLGRVNFGPREELPGPRQFQEVQRALKGAAMSVVRVSTEGQTVIYAAAPIQRARLVRGALLLSTQEGDVDRIIADERWDIIFVFLIASAVMFVLSVLLAGTIAEPVRRLSEAADRVRRGVRTREEIPDFSGRSDEIGQLSVSLRDMTEALFKRIEAIERFAADVAHELKNPLTSLRSAVETLPLARSSDSQARLTEIILHDVKRLDRLITDISSASRLDAELQRGEAKRVDLARLLSTIVGMRAEIARPDVAPVELSVATEPRGRRRLAVIGNESRLVQIFDNLIDNALSFSPKDGRVRISCRLDGARVIVSVEDDGPGIPDHALERIFERFYTDRPDQGFGQNSGLGLSISRQIVEAHGGTIHAENRLARDGEVIGARFVVALPAAPAPA